MRPKKLKVSEDGSSDSRNKQFTDAIISDITNHDYLVWNAAYERGYMNGRDYEAKMHSGFELTMCDVQAINKFALSIGYISWENHEGFHMLLRRLQELEDV